VEAFGDALALHDLAAYQLGAGLAADALGNEPEAAGSYLDATEITAFSFLWANLATVDGQVRELALSTIERSGRYDPTALVNAAAMREATDRTRAAQDLAAVMAQVPTLVFSTPPEGVFSDATWTAAQQGSIALLAEQDPAIAAAVARLADLDDQADRLEGAVSDTVALQALDLLRGAAEGVPIDVTATLDLLRAAPTSARVQVIVWLAAFEGGQQPLIDAVVDLSVPVFFNAPLPPMELVVGGSPSADHSLRLPRYPMASDFRQGPARPYAAAMLTIEPVFRPR
jgi:hypothetical protein